MEAETQETLPSNGMAKMPVELTLTVGTVTLPLARLMEMTEGQTFTDEVMSYFPGVRLQVGDRLVAEGELVRIEGRVGLRISRLLA